MHNLGKIVCIGDEMVKKEDGITLIELLVTMLIFGIILVIAGSLFSLVSRQFTQQSQIAQSQIEGIIGLEVLRGDLEQAGFGLPWSFQNAINYSEAAEAAPSAYNDSPAQPPRAIWSGNGAGLNGSDYLVVKSTVVSMNVTSQNWSYVTTGSAPKVWGEDDLQNNERVIVINPVVSPTVARQLVMNGGAFFTLFNSANFPSPFSPTIPTQGFIIYGVDPAADLRMPFNRADYYLSNTAASPPRCAPNTGILEKGGVNQADGVRNETPLLDCVADFQMAYRTTAGATNDLSTLQDLNGNSVIDAEDIRRQVTEVRVYILTHDGQRDTAYTFPSSSVQVGETIGGVALGRSYDLSANIGANWQNYRWKLFIITVRPINLQ